MLSTLHRLPTPSSAPPSPHVPLPPGRTSSPVLPPMLLALRSQPLTPPDLEPQNQKGIFCLFASTVCLDFSLVHCTDTELNTSYMLNIPAGRAPGPAVCGGAEGVAGQGAVQSDCEAREGQGQGGVAQPGRGDFSPRRAGILPSSYPRTCPRSWDSPARCSVSHWTPVAGQGGKQGSNWKDPTAQSQDDVVGPGNGEWDVGEWRGGGEELGPVDPSSILNVEHSMSWILEG